MAGVHVPLSIPHWWKSQTLPGKEAAGVRSLRLYLSDLPGAESGIGGIDSFGHGVRIPVTYSYEARIVKFQCVVKFRGDSNKRKTILKTISFRCRL